ncbi:MAG: ABC transporter permease [Bryobacteraceae bacterium]
MKQDILQALRGFRRSPGFTASALAVLALGIGANTAIFSVANAVLLRPLPFRDPSRLVLLWEKIPVFGPKNTSVSQPDFFDFRRENKTLEEVAAFWPENLNLVSSLSADARPDRVGAARASWTLFPVLGVTPALGRVYSEADDQPGANRVTVLSYDAWQARFHGDPAVIGRQIQLNSVPHTVIGIMPKGFEFPLRNMARWSGAELWIPAAFTPEQLQNRGDSFNTYLIARLKPAITLAQAASDADRIAQFIHGLYPKDVQKLFTIRGTATAFEEEVFGPIRTPIWILLAAVSMVLLIGCANVANLLLVRAAGRRREMAIRSALGASRARLVRQALTESLILAFAGGAAGVLLASWGLQLIVWLAPADIPRLDEASIDPLVLGFTAAASLLTGLLFGLAPAMLSIRASVNEGLKDGGRSASSRRGRLRPALIIGEVALSLILLAAAGLLIKSFARVTAVEPGFVRAGLLTFSTSLPDARYEKSPEVRAFYRRTVEALAALPGVTNAAAATSLPMHPSLMIMFSPEGVASGKWGRTLARNTLVDGDYFRTLGIPLRAGRYLGPLDGDGAPLTVIINETMAKKFWPNENALGRRLKWGSPQSTSPWLTIVGIVGDVKQEGLDQAALSAIYMPLVQTIGRGGRAERDASFAIRTAGDPASFIEAARKQLASIDPELPMHRPQTGSEAVEENTAPRRFPLLLVGMFAALAVVLAAVGLYGVMSYHVAQSTPEIGIRMALGASPADVLSLTLRQGMTLALIGLGVGVAGGLAVTRWLESLLYGVSTRDPWVFVGVAALLGTVMLAACWLPARRATRVDPMIALRQE